MRTSTDAFPNWVIAAAVGIVLGYGVATLQVDEAPAPDIDSGLTEPVPARAEAKSIATESQQLKDLRDELDAERRAREALDLELESLREYLGLNDPEVPLADPRLGNSSQAQPGSTSEGRAPSKESPAARALAAQREGQAWFDRAALEEAGFSSSEVEEIASRFEELEMEKLYLEDEGKRDGTFGTADYHRALAKLNRGLRQDLSEEEYDAYLFATGRDNRVKLREVLENSPAGHAGLEAGDVVISYSGTRVFHPGAFKRATARGDAGARVVLEVWRNGEVYRFSVPRGPLGIRMAPIKEPPLLNY